jgi:2-polyprenyl-3-methyl-5-hydroxy-6-metoxy-1,4-benzoquinol methylase
MASGDDEWFADESIWKDLYPFTFPESAFAVGDEQVEKILRLTGVGGGKVLDLCCGPGRHSVALAKRGFAVTAVDRTRFLLDMHERAPRKPTYPWSLYSKICGASVVPRLST